LISLRKFNIAASSFEPDVVCMLCVCHTTLTQKLFCLHVFVRLGHHNG